MSSPGCCARCSTTSGTRRRRPCCCGRRAPSCCCCSRWTSSRGTCRKEAVRHVSVDQAVRVPLQVPGVLESDCDAHRSKGGRLCDHRGRAAARRHVGARRGRPAVHGAGADVMAAFRTSPKVVRLPGIVEPKTSDMKIVHFADGVAPIHGVQPKRKRKKGGEQQAAPGKRAPKKRKVARPADDESGQAADADDDSSSSQSSSSTPNLPPAPKPTNSDFQKAVAAAAADPNAPRPSRARRPTRKY